MNAQRQCVVCRREELKPWRWPELQQCESCGYIRKNTPTNGYSEIALQEQYFDESFAQEDDRFVQFYEKQNAKRRLNQILSFKRAGRVLEIGVGRGTLLSTFKAHGFEVEGLDISEAVATCVTKQTGIDVQIGDLISFGRKYSGESYDVVVMSHVLEHIEELAESLRALSELLNEDGILYLAVPNVSCWNSYLPGWTGYEPYHLHYFQNQSLKRLLNTEKFQVLQTKTFEPLSGWFNAFTRSLRQPAPNLHTSSKAKVEPSTTIKLVYNAGRLTVGGITSPLRWLQSAIGRGEELVVIARVMNADK